MNISRKYGSSVGRRGLPRELVDAMYAAYLRRGSLEKVGKAFGGRSRQTIFGIFKARGLPLNQRTFLPVIVFRGRKYTAQKTQGRHRYLRETTKGRGNRGRRDRTIYLHHVIWEEEHGPIPPGHKLAFRDGNHLNCAIENLELLTNSEQVRKYASKGRNQFTKTAPSRLDLLIGNFSGGKKTLAADVKRRAA